MTASAIAMLTYPDSNILMHIVESHALYRPVLSRLTAAIDQGRMKAFTCELSLAEVLVKPIRDGDRARITEFEHLLTGSSGIEIVPIDRRLLRRSAELRVSLGGKLPDTIHVTAAEFSGCKVFLSEDQRIKMPTGLQLVSLANIAGLLPPPTP